MAPEATADSAASQEGAESPGRAEPEAPEGCRVLEQQQAGVKGGLLIGQVAGPAAQAGVAPGDVLLSINNQPVNSIENVKDAMAKAGKTVALLVMRDGDKIFVPVHLG